MTSAATLGIEGNSYIFDSFDDCSMILQVEKSGRTGYVFSESNSRGTDAVLLRDCEVSWGINAPFGLSSRDNVVSNASSAVIPVGPGRQRICMKCYSVTSSVKVRDDCPSLSFCSSECLSSSNAFLDECAPLITAVCSWGCDSLKTGARQYSDLAVLLILFLYNCEATRNASVSFQVRKLLALETHPSKNDAEISVYAALFLKAILDLAPTLLCKHSNTLNQMTILFRALQFNAQPLFIPGLPHGTSLLTILPNTLARINHSCAPNCAFTYAIREKVVGVKAVGSDTTDTVYPSSVREERKEEKTVGNEIGNEVGNEAVEKVKIKVEKEVEIVVWLTALKDIKAGESLVVSYLSHLCTPCDTRREMLQQSFFFYCQCHRCIREGIDGLRSHPGPLQIRKNVSSPQSTTTSTFSSSSRSSSSSSGSGSGNTTTTSTVPPSPSYATVYTTDIDSESRTKSILRRELDSAMRRIQDPGSGSPLNSTSSSSKSVSNRDNQSDAVSGTLTILQMCDLMVLTEHSYSKISKMCDGVRTTLTTTVSTKGQSVESDTDDVYCLHDAGMLVLGAAMKIRNLGPRSTKVESGFTKRVEDLGSESSADGLIVRASKVVTDCWTLIGSEVSVSRLETLLIGIAAGLRMRSVGDSHSGLDVSSMATDALYLLSILYHTDAENSERSSTEDSVDCTGVHASPGGTDVRKYRSCNPRYVTQARALCVAAIKGK